MSQAHNFKDITGQRFGRLTVLYRYPENAKHCKVQFSDTPEFADKDHFIHMIPNVNQNVPMQEDYYKRS